MADTSIDITFRISFITLSNVKVNFTNQKLNWRLYIIVKTFPIMRQVELVKKKEFVITTLDLNNETFVVYIAFLISFNLGLEIYLFQKAQIAFLKFDEAFTSGFFKYTDFMDIFFKDLAAKLLKYNRYINYTIGLVEGQQTL